MGFKTWKVTFTADLVSVFDIQSDLIHDALIEAIRKNAGYTGYLVDGEKTAVDQTNEIKKVKK